MPVSPYGGILFATLAAVGGAFDAQGPTPAPVPAQIVMSEDQTVVLDQIKAICARKEVEIITASADPASGTTLHLALVDSSGAFLPGASFSIAGQKLLGPEVNVRCRGDWLMMNMKPGEYLIKAEVDGQLRTRIVEVPKYGRVRVTMNAGDAHPDI